MNQTRLAHNYLSKRKEDYSVADLSLLNDYLNYKPDLPSYKVALVMISVNPTYWPYTGQVVEDIDKYFLPGHQTDVFVWSDMPVPTKEQLTQKEKALATLEEQIKKPITVELRGQLIFAAFKEYVEVLSLWKQVDQNQMTLAAKRLNLAIEFQPAPDGMNVNFIIHGISDQTIPSIIAATREVLRQQLFLRNRATIFEIEPVEWPYGTLLRYSLFLSQEEKLKEYDYIFYLDTDMRIVNVVGDEILGPGLTIAPHPGYYLRKELWPPYEPNDKSASFIKRPGKVIEMEGKPRFMPFYAAGGFQGGTSKSFIKAMKATKKLIDDDLNKNNYIPIWNDETAWNKYVFDMQTKEQVEQTVFLTPSYIYPDSLIKEYYEKFWGRSYPPRIITLTKPFTTTKVDMNRFTNM